MNSQTLIAEPTVAPGGASPRSGAASGSEDWAIYHDGSGKASDELENNLKTIREREAVHKIQRRFIAKHKDTLAGLHWRVGCLDPEIDLHHGWYRGKRATPADVARLFPNVKWMRKKQKYGRENERDWVGELDGITPRIEAAETYKPAPIPGDGERVILPNR